MTIMSKYWCVNFETDANLHYGIDKNLWMMGYQYADDQNDLPPRKAAITRNWTKLVDISPGDRFVAYLPGNRFYATGTVRTPRRPKTSRDRTDTIEPYLERGKSYRSGFVYFNSSVVYENFTDQGDDYPVRIDVEGWHNYASDGVSVTGLNVPRYKTVNAVFEINKKDFDRIAKKLASQHGTTQEDENGGVKVAENEAVVEALEKSYARSQGFLLDSKTRKALENYAMDKAKRYFTSKGYTWDDHSKSQPYDLLCTRKKEHLYVEVKGTQTSGDGIILTSGEVQFGRRHKGRMALFLLHSIRVSGDGTIQTEGVKDVVLPWDVDQGCLKPISFVYTLKRN